MAHEVFISYAAEDKVVATAVCKALEDAGIRCWYAPRDIAYGAIWEEAIVEAISESLLMVLILSSHANETPQVKREVGNACAKESQVLVVPFIIEEVHLNPTLKYYLHSLHRLNASTPPLEDHIRLLVKHAQSRLRILKEQREKREADERRKRAEEEAERQRLAEAETRRAAEERKWLEEEDQRRQEAEAQRLREEAERQRALEERQRLEEEERQREAARQLAAAHEVARRAEEERARAEEKADRIKEEEETRRLEEEAAARRQSEERRREEDARIVREAEEGERRRAVERAGKSSQEVYSAATPQTPPAPVLLTDRAPESLASLKSTVKTPEGTPSTSSKRTGQKTRAGLVRVLAIVNRWKSLSILSAVVMALVIATATWLIYRRYAVKQPINTHRSSQQNGQNENVTPPSKDRVAQEENVTPPPGMVYVPGGTFEIGRNDGDDFEKPAHDETVTPFFMDIYEVTCEDYKKFLDERPNQAAPSDWKGRAYKDGDEHKPVVGVSFYDAQAYAQWAGKRLPTEAEWEFAARGKDKRLYPWEGGWKEGYANANRPNGELADVGTHQGMSPFGLFDMVGNAWEWTTSKLKEYPGGKRVPKQSKDLRVIRGGDYSAVAGEQATTTYRGFKKARGSNYNTTGFRCASDIIVKTGLR